MSTTLVVGLGSCCGDDEAGWIALSQLQQDMAYDPAMDFVTCDRSGLEWLTRLQSVGRIVFIDAMRSGADPGFIRKVDLSGGALFEHNTEVSSHAIGIVESIGIAQSLGDMPDNISFWGVEAAAWDCAEGLSDPVKAAIPRLVQHIRTDLGQYAG